MQIVGEWAGHYYDLAENSDKIWAAACTDNGGYLAVWGRRGNRKYQFQSKQFNGPTSARAEFDKMVAQKSHKGYQNVPFEDNRFGNIPSFTRSLIGNTGGTTTVKITPGKLLERVLDLINRVKERFEPDTMLVEFLQLRAASSLVLEYREALSSESESDLILADLEIALNTLSRCTRQAMLA